MIKKKTLPTDGFVRQEDNPGSIVNVDKNGLQAYKLKREAEKRKEKVVCENHERDILVEKKGGIWKITAWMKLTA
jgi:hypothetical protein